MDWKKTTCRVAAGLLLASTLMTSAFAVTGTVDTGSSILRVRSEGSTAGSVLAKLTSGVEVEVLSVTEDGWYQITCDGVTGYVSGDYLVVNEEDAANLPVEGSPIYLKVTASALNVRSGPGTDYDRVRKLTAGAVVMAVEEASDGWYQIEDGYVSAEYVEVVDAEEASNSSKGQEIANYALTFVGCPYVYGGNSPKGFDCSGFTKYVYNHFGITINRTASTQLDNGTSVSQSELQPGDLIMFKKGSSSKRATHVGLYIGGGKFVHASSSRVGVIVTSLTEAYYTNKFVGARRLV